MDLLRTLLFYRYEELSNALKSTSRAVHRNCPVSLRRVNNYQIRKKNEEKQYVDLTLRQVPFYEVSP